MALVTTKRNVDVLPGQAAPTVFHCSQHDVGATIILGLVNAGGNFSIPSGVTAIIQGSCSNGAVFTPVTATVSGSDITFNLSAEMTSIAGPTVCEAVLSKDTDVLGTANFILDVEPSAMGGDTPPVFTDAAWLWMVDKMGSETVSALGDKTVIDAIESKLDKDQGTANAGKYLKVGADGNVETAELDVTTDKTLSIADKAADAKAVGDELDGLKADLSEIQENALTNDIRDALLQLASKVAYIDDDGQDYYNALESALYPPVTLVSISAQFTQGSNIVYNTDSLDSLKNYLTVTAHYDNSTEETITAYTLSGQLTTGTSQITVTYGGKTASFTVTVTADPLPSGYTRYDYIQNSATSGNDWVVNTGIAGTYSSVDYLHEITFKVTTSFDAASSALYGQRNTSGSAGASNGRALWLKSGDNNIAANYAGVDTGFIAPLQLNEKYTSITADNKWYMNGSIIQDNISSSWSAPNNAIMLFGVSTGGTSESSYNTCVKSKVNIYSFKVQNIESGDYVSIMIPCKNSENVPGFYDSVRNTFITSSVPTKLVAGNDEV